MASQAPGEPSDRRASGRKRNADTYLAAPAPPLIAQRLSAGTIDCKEITVNGETVSGGGLTQTTEAKLVNFLSPNDSFTQNITCSKIGSSVTIYFDAVSGTTTAGGLQSVAQVIPPEYRRPLSAPLRVPVWMDIRGTGGWEIMELSFTGYYEFFQSSGSEIPGTSSINIAAFSVTYLI